MLKIIHYRERCIGCGVCQEMQPELWRMSRKDGKATLLKAITKKEVHILEVGDWAADTAERVAEACPVKIIKVG